MLQLESLEELLFDNQAIYMYLSWSFILKFSSENLLSSGRGSGKKFSEGQSLFQWRGGGGKKSLLHLSKKPW